MNSSGFWSVIPIILLVIILLLAIPLIFMFAWNYVISLFHLPFLIDFWGAFAILVIFYVFVGIIGHALGVGK